MKPPKQKIKSLSEAAESLIGLMAKGGVVTAEYSNGMTRVDSFGEIGVKECAPERILFEIGSITKVFTGLLLAVAINEGRVTLETSVSELLPEILFEDSRVGEITLKQLVTHTSGLARDLAETENLLLYDSDPSALLTREEFFKFLSGTKMKKDGPYPFDYSNIGLGLLGELISVVYHRPWGNLIAEKITKPLGMLDTVATLSEEQKSRRAQGYLDRAEMPNMKVDAIAGCGVLCSTAMDLITLGKALLEPEKSTLQAELDLMLQVHDEDSKIGLAIALSPFCGHQIYSHDGCTSGYNASLIVFPDAKEVIVIMANNFTMVVWAFLCEMYGQETRYTIPHTPVEKKKLEELAGVYKANEEFGFWSGAWRIFIHNDELWGQFKCHGFFKLGTNDKLDYFSSRFAAGPFLFERDDEGEVVTLTVGSKESPMAVAVRSEEALADFTFLPITELDTYRGVYHNDGGETLIVKSMNHTLYLIHTGVDPSTGDFLYANKDDRFESEDGSCSLGFRKKGARVIAAQLIEDDESKLFHKDGDQ